MYVTIVTNYIAYVLPYKRYIVMHMLYKYFMIDMMNVILLLLLYSSSFAIRFDIFLNNYWRYRFPTSGNVVAMDTDHIINP